MSNKQKFNKINLVNEYDKENIESYQRNNFNLLTTDKQMHKHNQNQQYDQAFNNKRNQLKQVKKSPIKKDFLKNVTTKKDNKECKLSYFVFSIWTNTNGFLTKLLDMRQIIYLAKTTKNISL